MVRIRLKSNCMWAVVFAGMLAASPALAADKSSWGQDKGNKGGKSEQREKSDNRQDGRRADEDRSPRDSASAARTREYFGDQHRTRAQEYYRDEFRRGNCPPGLAKKNNGCMPPGQAKKWSVGRPLPRDVIFYNVPPALVVHFGQPPRGHRYVRVASDILLITIGTGMVIDAIQDLGRM